MAKIILCAGGTGGHIFPALAVADAIKKERADAKILFMGSLVGPEGKLAEKAGLEFVGLNVRGLLGRGLRAVPAAVRLVAAVGKAAIVERKFAPDAVAAFGGYASAAPALAARLLGKPVFLHEQNAVAGAGNRFLAKMAKTVCVTFPDTVGFARETILTGAPVRSDIAAKGRIRGEAGTKRLLVLGGSQGARALNRFMAGIARDLEAREVEVWHQCGEKDEAATREAYAKVGATKARVTPFIDDMAAAYAWADVAFCRAGASALSELCVSGLPAILCPFPAAIYDHQTFNARWLERGGAAILKREDKLEKNDFLTTLDAYFADSSRRESMSRAALALAKPDAAKEIAREILKMAGKRA